MKQLKRDLQAVSKSLKQLMLRTEKIAKKLGKLEKAKAKLKATKKPVKVSAAATVLAVIKRSRKGVDVATLGKRLALRAGKSVVSFSGSKKRAKSRIAERAFM